MLEGVCENDRGRLFKPSMYSKISRQHHHSFSRESLYSNAYDYQNELYYLVVEKERIVCYNKDRPVRQRNTPFHSMRPEDVEQYMFPEEGSNLACYQIFPAATPCVLTVYIGNVDTINWTMQLRRENATALLQLSDMWEIPYHGLNCNMGKFLLIKGLAPV